MLPVSVTVRVLPLSVAGPEISVYVTGSPELAVAVSVIGATPSGSGPGFGKVMVCGAGFTAKVWLTGGAAA